MLRRRLFVCWRVSRGNVYDVKKKFQDYVSEPALSQTAVGEKALGENTATAPFAANFISPYCKTKDGRESIAMTSLRENQAVK